MQDHLKTTYHKKLRTGLTSEPSKTSKVKSSHRSFYSPSNKQHHHRDLLPNIRKALAKSINPSISIVKNFKIINIETATPIIAKPQPNTQRPIRKLTEIVNEIACNNNNNRNKMVIKKAMFSRKSYGEYYRKLAHKSNHPFTQINSFDREKTQRTEGNGSDESKKKVNPNGYSISKEVTKEYTMSTNSNATANATAGKYPNDIEAVKIPEELHYFFVQMIQRGKNMEFDIDVDDNNGDDGNHH